MCFIHKFFKCPNSLEFNIMSKIILTENIWKINEYVQNQKIMSKIKKLCAIFNCLKITKNQPIIYVQKNHNKTHFGHENGHKNKTPILR